MTRVEQCPRSLSGKACFAGRKAGRNVKFSRRDQARETLCSTLFLFPTPLLLLQVEMEEEVKEEENVKVEIEDEVDMVKRLRRKSKSSDNLESELLRLV